MADLFAFFVKILSDIIKLDIFVDFYEVICAHGFQ